MANVSKQTKATAATALKAIIPKSWKWSLSVRDHATLVLTISAAPVDLVGSLTYPSDCNHVASGYVKDRAEFDECSARYAYYLKSGDMNGARRSANTFKTWEDRELFEFIDKAMNVGNFDDSDSQSDYFSYGWLTRIQFGSYDKPFFFDQGVSAREEAKQIAAACPAPIALPARKPCRI